MSAAPPIDAVRSALLAGVPHGFLGRAGGVSEGLYASLNVGLGSNDDPAAVAENRWRAAGAIRPGATLVTPHQIHSARAAIAEPTCDAERPHADALVTDRADLVIGVLTADCVPVLLADRHAGVVGAAHAGWKGALGGVIAATVDAMVSLGAERDRIAAAIGPCIGARSYEVSDGFPTPFLAEDPAFDRFFRAGRTGHRLFDIEGFVAARLAAAGVPRIDLPGLDTYADEARFFSYRRATHRGEPDYGRQIALIGLPG